MLSNKQFRKTYLMQIGLGISDSLIFSLIWFYLFSVGYSLKELLLIVSFTLFIPVVAIAFIKHIKTKFSIILGFSCSLLAYLLIILSTTKPVVYVALSLSALKFALFWMPYNIEFYSYTTKHNRAFSGGLQIGPFPIIGMIMPAIGGYVFHYFGFNFVLGIACCVMLLMIFYVMKNTSIKTVSFDYNIFNVMASLKKSRTLLFIQGTFESSYMVGVAVFTLMFIKSEINIGLFASFLGLFSVIATLILARLSDKLKKRTVFVYPIIIVTALSVMSLGFTSSALSWVLLAAVLNFFVILILPFLIAVPMDAKIDNKKLWVGRELLLNLGRSFGGFIFFTTFIFTSHYKLGFIILGTILLLYPIILYLKEIYEEKNV